MRTVVGCPSTSASSSKATRRSDPSRLKSFIQEHADLLRADVCVVCDGDTFDDDGTPAIGYGLRGIAYWEVRVRGPRHDVHSGQYGGGVENPANVLVRMLASLTDAGGRVTVPGFYDQVRDLTDEEHAAYAALPFDEGAWADETGVPAPMDGERATRCSSACLRDRPSTSTGSGAAIPARGQDHHSRLGGRQDQHPPGARPGPPGDRGFREATSSRWRRRPAGRGQGHPRWAAGHHAARSPRDRPCRPRPRGGFGKPPLFHRSGGSVPVVAALDAHLGLKTLMVGFANPTGNFHAPNEWMRPRNIRHGMVSLVHLWGELSTMSGRDLRGGERGSIAEARSDAAQRRRRSVASARRRFAPGGGGTGHSAPLGRHGQGAELPDARRPSTIPALEPRGHDQRAATASIRHGAPVRLDPDDGRGAAPTHAAHRLLRPAVAGPALS